MSPLVDFFDLRKTEFVELGFANLMYCRGALVAKRESDRGETGENRPWPVSFSQSLVLRHPKNRIFVLKIIILL